MSDTPIYDELVLETGLDPNADAPTECSVCGGAYEEIPDKAISEANTRVATICRRCERIVRTRIEPRRLGQLLPPAAHRPPFWGSH